MSDRAIPKSFRMMQGVRLFRRQLANNSPFSQFGVNTYTLINKGGERHFVKFHFTPELGVHSLAWDEGRWNITHDDSRINLLLAMKLNGQDPDFHRKDLEEAITNGAYPRWTFEIQVIPEGDQDKFDFEWVHTTFQ